MKGEHLRSAGMARRADPEGGSGDTAINPILDKSRNS